MSRLGWSETIGLGGCLLLAACPLPDRDINVITEEVNNSPVRLIEPIGLSKAQQCECDIDASGCDPKEPDEEFKAECPLPDVIGLPHYMDPSADPAYRFCKCGEGLLDSGALFPVEFFAEDQDKEPDEDGPKDSLYAAILLNTSPDGSPTDDVSYVPFRSPTDPLPSVVGYGYEPPGRPTPYVRRIFVGDPETLRWDLCNGDPKVKPGFNTFAVLVTDRNWNEVTLEPDPDAAPSEPTIQQQVGVVDVAGGATYDTQTYTFYCSSADDPNNPVTPNPGAMGHDPFGCAERCQ